MKRLCIPLAIILDPICEYSCKLEHQVIASFKLWNKFQTLPYSFFLWTWFVFIDLTLFVVVWDRMLLLEAWHPKCFLFGLFLSLLCWRLLLWHLMEIGGPSGLDISSLVGLHLVFLFVVFILEEDLNYLDCLDQTCSFLLGGHGLFWWTFLWSSYRALDT